MPPQVQAAKKPQTAYFLWLSAKREEIQKEIRAKDIKSVAARASELWKNISEADKKPFEEEAKRQKDAFEVFKGTAEGQKALEEKKAERAEKKEAKQERAVKAAVKAVEKDDALKRPQTAYFAWLNDNRERIAAELGGKGTLPEVTKKGSEMWKALSEKERKPWEDKAKQEKEAYDAFLKTPEGAAKLQAYKDATSAAKAEVTGGNDQDETATSPGSKRKQGDAAEPSPKKAKGVRGKPAVKKQEESIQIPKDVVIACEAAQKKANADVSYEALVRKLLETERLAKQNLTPMQALDAIVSSKGLLNPARNMLISKLGA